MLDEQNPEVIEQARILWQKYFALTKELLKYSDQKDNDLFIELVNQRDQLIEKIKSLPPNDYRQSRTLHKKSSLTAKSKTASKCPVNIAC